MSLDALFSPRAVAVIGASQRELTIGYRIIQNLLDFGYAGAIYPVNPKGGEILGRPAFPSITAVPAPVDVAHLVIRNTLVPGCIEECARRGVRFAIVNTAGFRETGAEGAELEAQLVEVARVTGVRIFGPNCQGIINTDPASRAYCNFTFTRPAPGPVSIVAQSGGVGEVIHQRLTELEVGIRHYASNGNACDVSIPEILLHYGADAQTRVVIVHIESLADPRAFLEAAAEISARKPILAMKVGRTAEGAEAVRSHTGRLLDQAVAVELVFDKAGIVPFRSIEDLCQAALAFARQPIPRGKRVGMIANTGGPAIIATDELIEGGLTMPPLSPATAASLRERLLPEASIHNPVDVLATAGPEHFAAALRALLDDDGIDALFLNFVTPFFVDTRGVARAIADAAEQRRKPIVATVMTEKRGWAETLRILRAAGVPTYDMPETGARALCALGRYAAGRRRAGAASRLFPEVDAARAAALLAAVAQRGRTALSAAESLELLTCYGIPVARYRGANDAASCLAAAAAIGYPVVLKVDAPTVLHKTDAGGVVLDLREPAALRQQVEQLAARFAEAEPRFLVQEQVAAAREVIIGGKYITGLGHAVMFGLGGIHVEVLKDVAFRLVPLAPEEAGALVTSVRAAPLLEGVRGQPPVDRPALVEIVLRVAQLLTDHPQVVELDLNPVLAAPQGAKAVDARVILSTHDAARSAASMMAPAAAVKR